ncbi:MAG: fumarate hydratase, class [Shewanella sp.]|nr:fumarate hydratase, class [Shewanella sp.]
MANNTVQRGTIAYRSEEDSMGSIQVPADRYWGAQTQRSSENFRIGGAQRFNFSPTFIRAYAILKKSAALANLQLGLLDRSVAQAIVAAADEVIAGQLQDNFPLVVWQTGSGTQTNMNLNEVLAGRANELLTGKRGGKTPVHPNDHVNKGQSSNDTFPTAMHLAASDALVRQLLPVLDNIITALQHKAVEWQALIKIGRTHLQDATPLTLGQEFSAFATQFQFVRTGLKQSLNGVLALPIGGTAVGTGLNSHKDFPALVVKYASDELAQPFREMDNKFFGLAAHEPLVQLSGALKTTAVAAMKLANDIRLLGSGPRCGLNELLLPANEPGSSIMPGKVNPTQCEALSMVCCQVIGNDAAVTAGGMQGQLQLNVFKPLIIHNVLQSIQLLSDALASFNEHCLQGLMANHQQLTHNLEHSLMLVTALNPVIGYDKAAQVAKKALKDNISLQQAAEQLGFLSKEAFNQAVRPERMLAPDD